MSVGNGLVLMMEDTDNSGFVTESIEQTELRGLSIMEKFPMVFGYCTSVIIHHVLILTIYSWELVRKICWMQEEKAGCQTIGLR